LETLLNERNHWIKVQHNLTLWLDVGHHATESMRMLQCFVESSRLEADIYLRLTLMRDASCIKMRRWWALEKSDVLFDGPGDDYDRTFVGRRCHTQILKGHALMDSIWFSTVNCSDSFAMQY
jgi:hypothetical protein